VVQNRPIDPPKNERNKLRLVTYFDRGRLRGKYVDHYIADSLENMSILQQDMAIRVMNAMNMPLKAILTAYNPGFQLYNLRRDWIRFRKAMPQFDAKGRRRWGGITRAVRFVGTGRRVISR
jgi:hypothetical protein